MNSIFAFSNKINVVTSYLNSSVMRTAKSKNNSRHIDFLYLSPTPPQGYNRSNS